MDKIVAKEIGARVREVRKEVGLSQKSFGQKVGVSLPTVTRVETGQRFPDAEMLIAINRVFGADVTWLLTGGGGATHAALMTPVSPGLSIPLARRLSVQLSDLPAEDIDALLSLPGFPQGAIAFRSTDDGCAPRVCVGDIVIFMPGTCDDGDSVVVTDVWGRGVVRQRHEQAGKGRYIADHPGYALMSDDDVTCLGKLCGVVKRIG